MKKKFVPAGKLPSPAYFWLLNEPMTPEKIKKHLRLMADQGMRAVCPHPWPKCFRSRTMPSFMEPDYLTPAYFDMLKVIAEECRALGMYCYLYDEGGWPSGYAAGRVRRADPESFAPYFIDENLQIQRSPMPPEGEIPVADLLNRQAVEKFIALTHVPATEKCREYAGNVLFAAFTDEPHFSRTNYGNVLPWCEDFDRIFLKLKNYDILPFLKQLFVPPQDEEDWEITRARIDFHDVFSQLFVKNYFEPIRKFCRRNKMLSGGHLDLDHDPAGAVCAGSGHLMRSLRALDLPGIDVISRQIMPGKEHLPFAKFASSAARQSGKKFSMAEIFAVYGSGITPQQMKFVIDTVMADGINILVLSGYASSHKNMLSHLRPHLDTVDPLWKFGRIRNRYIENLGKWLLRGKDCTPVALYFDQRSFWAGGRFSHQAESELKRLSQAVFDRGSDFDFADDDLLARAEKVSGGIKIGRKIYRHLLLPDNALLSPEAENNLREKNIVVSSLEDLESLWYTPPPAGVRIVKRVWRKREIYFVFNTSAEEKTLPLPPEKSFAKIDPASEREEKTSVEKEITIPPFDSVLLVPDITGCSAVCAGREISLCNQHIRTVRRVVCTDNDFKWRNERVSLVPDSRELQNIAGRSFSGEICYQCDFELENTGNPLLLRLTDVHFAAEVFLNGRNAGQKLFAPFDFVLKKHLKKGVNRLEIFVSNTLANLLTSEETFSQWEKNSVLLSPYEKRQRTFETESVSMGEAEIRLFEIPPPER